MPHITSITQLWVKKGNFIHKTYQLVVPRSLRTTSYPSSELVLADYDDMPQGKLQGKLQEHRDHKKEKKKRFI